jgi:hypothetical protein
MVNSDKTDSYHRKSDCIGEVSYICRYNRVRIYFGFSICA